MRLPRIFLTGHTGKHVDKDLSMCLCLGRNAVHSVTIHKTWLSSSPFFFILKTCDLMLHKSSRPTYIIIRLPQSHSRSFSTTP